MIPVCTPLLDASALHHVTEALRSGWVSSLGPYLDTFEQQWASYCGMPYGIAVSSGTAALEIAVAALALEREDEVLLPSFTIVSCANAVVAAGARPVLVDCDPETWCMDVDEVAAKITSRTRAIMPVHMYGHPVDLDPLLNIADRVGAVIVEDAAEAHGALYKGRRVGSFGDMSCFSFYANKIVTTGEGGMVLARRADMAERLRGLRNLCFQSDRRFFHTEFGRNYRLTNLQAAIGVSQIASIAATIRRKRDIAHAYVSALSGCPGLTLPVERDWAMNVYWMFGLVLRDEVPLDAAEFGRRLAVLGIETRPFFLGMHEQPVFRKMGLFTGECYPTTERIARRGLYLPSGVALTDDDLHRVCEAVRTVLREA
jgi:perosamine synthetase